MTFASTIINEYLSFKPFHIDGDVEHSESEAEDASKRANFLSACTSRIYTCVTTSKSCLNSLADRVALARPRLLAFSCHTHSSLQQKAAFTQSCHHPSELVVVIDFWLDKQ